ncbi:MAG: hypothetical protein FWH37_04210 [Candidatus Bathyarchaeota archaeon]|nr:hypothetical protein [Candidatus Termiticorpusculum sp.]
MDKKTAEDYWFHLMIIGTVAMSQAIAVSLLDRSRSKTVGLVNLILGLIGAIMFITASILAKKHDKRMKKLANM